MELQKLAQDARLLLQSRGSIEIPPSTGILPFPWAHPDLLIQTLKSGVNDRFVLQSALCGPEHRGVERFTPYLVWLLQPFAPGWINRLTELVNALLGHTDSSLAYLEISGKRPHTQIFLEPGALWNLTWQAVPLGEVQVWGRILGEELVCPAGVCVLNLRQIVAVRMGEPSQSQSLWSATLSGEEILAWQRSPRLSLDTEGVFQSRLAHERWEGLKTQIDSHLGNKHWLEAYNTSMEAAVMLLDGQACGLPGEAFKAGAEPALRELLYQIPSLLPRKSPVAGKNNKEAILR